LSSTAVAAGRQEEQRRRSSGCFLATFSPPAFTILQHTAAVTDFMAYGYDRSYAVDSNAYRTPVPAFDASFNPSAASAHSLMCLSASLH